MNGHGMSSKYFEIAKHMYDKPMKIKPTLDEDAVVHLIVRLSNKMTRNTERLIESRFDLKVTEWRILALLGVNESLTMQAVCDLRMILPNEVYVNAVKLQNRGYIDFEEADVYSPAHITPEGLRVYHKVLPFMQGRQARLMANLSDEGKTTFTQIASGLEDIFDNEFKNIHSEKLAFDELSDVISGDDAF